MTKTDNLGKAVCHIQGPYSRFWPAHAMQNVLEFHTWNLLPPAGLSTLLS
jgi:hypothetical protein